MSSGSCTCQLPHDLILTNQRGGHVCRYNELLEAGTIDLMYVPHCVCTGSVNVDCRQISHTIVEMMVKLWNAS